jgi:hypothetical protein
MAVGDVVLFDVVATLGGRFSATLAAGPSTLCVGSSILVAGWFVRMLVSCRIVLTCFAFAVADDGIFPPSAVRRSCEILFGVEDPTAAGRLGLENSIFRPGLHPCGESST